LTAGEWSLILRGWHCHDTRGYEQGEVVMQYGKVYPAMFQLAQGRCRIELHNKVQHNRQRVFIARDCSLPDLDIAAWNGE